MISGIDRMTARRGALLLVAGAGGAFAAAQSVLAQEDPELSIDVGDCVELESPEARFECYESRVESARSRSGAAESGGDAVDAAAADADVSRPSRSSSASNDDEARDDDAGFFGSGAGGEKEFTGTIAALREGVPNEYRITLDNGQVWQQMRPEQYPLRVGHEVRIYPTRWGDSYRLTVEDLNGFIQVERVR